MAYLVLVRHGVTEWNALGKWTGLTDVPLSEDGRKEAAKAADALQHIDLHRAYSSSLQRAKETLDIVLQGINRTDLPRSEHDELQERDYGELTGKNKWEVKEQVGDEQFTAIRRGWDTQPPGGESLKDVSARTLPFFEQHILTDLKAGKNVIVAAHGNSLRSIMKHLEQVSDEDSHKVEIMTAEVIAYELDDGGQVISKKLLLQNSNQV
jgi:2,3-bisphosphoglycerate-dependent phosphoglycerate mutase